MPKESTRTMPTGSHFPDLMRVREAESKFFTPEPGLRRRILAHNEHMMLVEHRMETGWAGTRHSHPHDQMVYVIEGRLRFSCGTEVFEVASGDSFVLRGGIEHQAWASEPGIVLDVFTPCREDYVASGGRTEPPA